METAVTESQETITFEWPRNPFPGLRPFREDEALIFYGRNSHKDEVLARLNDAQLVFVTGPSGCGKSSLIKAGVIPALQAGLLTKAGYRWTSLQMRPGQRPLVSLATAFRSLQIEAAADGAQGRGLDSMLAEEDAGLWLATEAIMPLRQAAASEKAPARLLLLVDQFEEIFGEQIQEPAEVDRFVRLLVRFAERPHPNLFIIVTMRSDYLGQCANFEGLAESINRTQFLTPVLTPDELDQAIARPAEDYHGEVEPRLVERIIGDMRTGTAYHADSLPLMQHALLWMWTKAWKGAGKSNPPRPPFDDNDPSTRLFWTVYQDNGGINGILDRHAEDVLGEAVGESKERWRIAEIVFRRLSERDPEGRYRRSPTSAEELCSIAGCSGDELQQIIEPFEHPDVCFLEQRQSEGTNEVLVDVSHESLIRQWNRAKAWADAEAEKVAKFRDLAHAALAWEAHGRSHDFLKRRGELEVHNAWWQHEGPSRVWARRYALGPEGEKLADIFPRVEEYLRVSSETDRAEREAAERARIAHASERSRRQRDRVLAIAVFLVLLSLSVVGLLYWQTKEYDDYRVRTTALLADASLKVDGPASALLLVMEGINANLPQLPEIQRVGYRALAQLRERQSLEGHGAQVATLQFAPGNKPIVITTSRYGYLWFWNLETGKPIAEIQLTRSRFLAVRWSPDGKQLYVSTRDTPSYFLVPCSQPALREYFPDCAATTEDIKRTFGQEAGAGSFSPDGRWIVTSAFNAAPKLWDVSAINQPLKELPGIGSFNMGAAFSHDSQRLAVGTATGEIRVFRFADILQQAEPVAEAELKPRVSARESGSQSVSRVNSLAFHPKDTGMLLATYQDGSTRVWNIAKKEETLLRVGGTVVYQGAFNPEGTWVATAHDDRVVRLWPLRAAEPTHQVLRGHTRQVTVVAYSADGKTIASGSGDGTVRIWSQEPTLGRDTVGGEAKFNETGKASVRKADDAADELTLSYNNTSYTLTAPAKFGKPVAAAVSPSGRDAVIAPSHGRPYLFNLASKQYIVALPGRPEDWRQIGFSRVTKPGEGSAERIIGITQSGTAYSWRYFSDLAALKAFALNHRPLVNGVPLQIQGEVACRLQIRPESECPTTEDSPADD
jgi:WD40 repeat protein